MVGIYVLDVADQVISFRRTTPPPIITCHAILAFLPIRESWQFVGSFSQSSAPFQVAPYNGGLQQGLITAYQVMKYKSIFQMIVQ